MNLTGDDNIKKIKKDIGRIQSNFNNAGWQTKILSPEVRESNSKEVDRFSMKMNAESEKLFCAVEVTEWGSKIRYIKIRYIVECHLRKEVFGL